MVTGEKDPRSPRVLTARLGFLLPALLLGGCATTYELKVDSIAKPRAADAISYEIHNKNPLVADDSLRFKEAAGFVKTALSGRGMYEAPANTK
ncbi:MAG: hypothetical protein ACKPB0_12065, partial [Opitutaceae bacterium]